MDRSLITTALELPNHRITACLGVVRGVTVRSRSVVGSLGAALQTLRGGNITLLTELCEQSRAEAFEIMIRHAVDVGATGIVAVRYDATEVMSGVTEVLCYGTAVHVAPA
ncbi:MAG TPA: YbjQ family protein [Gemmatimonadaceae bacterium]